MTRKARSTGFCYHGHVSDESFSFRGALVREQNVVFAVVEVAPSVMDGGEVWVKAEREKYRPIFPEVPIIFASKLRDGRARYMGRPDIVRFLVSAGWSRIPWKQYKARKKDRNPFRDWA
jgi:hypothetical protein